MKSGSTLYYSNGNYLKSGSTFYYVNGNYAKSGRTLYRSNGDWVPSNVNSLSMPLTDAGNVMVSRAGWSVVSTAGAGAQFIISEDGDILCR